MYEIMTFGYRSPIAQARNWDGYHKAIKDKIQNPELPFNVVEYSFRGVTLGSLMWQNGRWC